MTGAGCWRNRRIFWVGFSNPFFAFPYHAPTLLSLQSRVLSSFCLPFPTPATTLACASSIQPEDFVTDVKRIALDPAHLPSRLLTKSPAPALRFATLPLSNARPPHHASQPFPTTSPSLTSPHP